MKTWLRALFLIAPFIGGIAAAVSGIAIGTDIPTSIARGVAVGLVAYMLLGLFGRALGARRSSGEPDPASEATPGSVPGDRSGI